MKHKREREREREKQKWLEHSETLRFPAVRYFEAELNFLSRNLR